MNNKLPLSTNQQHFFITSFFILFIMVCLQYLGFSTVFPEQTQANEDTTYATVAKKLEQNKNYFSLSNESTFEQTNPINSSTSYILLDLDTGDVLTQHNALQQVPIASLTKVMTAIVALDLTTPETLFTVSDHASSIEPTKLWLIPGEQLSLHELLDGLLLVSANDAAEVIKEGIDQLYGEEIFINAMNEKAKQIGMHNTSFANAQGFDDARNYSSAADLAILTHYVMNHYPLIIELSEKEFGYLPENKYHRAYYYNNWNGLLGVYPEAKGLKIGNTDDAGKTTIVTSSRSGKNLAAIVLGSPNITARDLWAAQLLDLGYQETLGLDTVAITKQRLYSKYQTWNN